MTEKEYQIFKDTAMNRLTGEGANNSITEIMENEDSGDQTLNVQAVKRSITARNRMEIKDKPQFKRKRAKVIIVLYLFPSLSFGQANSFHCFMVVVNFSNGNLQK